MNTNVRIKFYYLKTYYISIFKSHHIYKIFLVLQNNIYIKKYLRNIIIYIYITLN